MTFLLGVEGHNPATTPADQRSFGRAVPVDPFPQLLAHISAHCLPLGVLSLLAPPPRSLRQSSRQQISRVRQLALIWRSSLLFS